MTDAELIASLRAEIFRLKSRNSILRSALNFYGIGLNYARGHHDQIILKDQGENAHKALLKEHLIGIEDGDYDKDFIEKVQSGKIDASVEVLTEIKAQLQKRGNNVNL